MSQRIPIFQGQVIDLGLEQVTLPNGTEVTLEVVRHPGASAVLPLHTDGTVTLVYQFRLCAVEALRTDGTGRPG